MDRSAFYDILENPELSGSQEKELEQLTKEYPWFGLGQMLYTKALHKNEDSRFDDQLLLASVYSYDRENLFEVIQGGEIEESMNRPSTIAQEPEVKETDYAEASSVKEIEESMNRPSTIAQEPEVKETDYAEASSVKEKEPEPESIKEPDQRESAGPSTNAQGPLETIEEEPEPESIEEPDQRESADLDLRKSAGPSTNAQEPLEPIEDVEGSSETKETDYAEASSVKNQQLQKQILTGAVSRVIEKEVEETHFELAGEIDEDQQPPIKKVEVDESYSPMTAWLLNRANEMKYEVEVTTKIPAKNLESEEFRLDQSQKIVLDKKSKSSLLDAFIKKDAKISKGKATEYESGNRAADSLKDSDDFLTETMAMIYAKQGKIAKAKKAYKKLSLIYPEKSIYFAARIKELDKK